jgi:hypothetical protein
VVHRHIAFCLGEDFYMIDVWLLAYLLSDHMLFRREGYP